VVAQHKAAMIKTKTRKLVSSTSSPSSVLCSEEVDPAPADYERRDL